MTGSVERSATRTDLPDAVSWLTLYLVLLVALPSRLVVTPLGGAGSPSLVLGFVGLLWWAWHHLSRWRDVDTPRRPVRTALGIFVVAVGLSYVTAMLRPIEAGEVATADLSLLALLGWSGTLLVASDGIPSRERLEEFVRRLALAGGFLATLGIAQFVAGQSFVDQIEIPGLTTHQAVVGAFSREGFTRPSATAVHPIEFGVVVTMLLPFALHTGFFGGARSRFARWFPAVAIAAVIPLSLSRSAVVGAAACLAVLVPTWPRARRRVALLAIGAVGLVTFVTVPGMLGTLLGLFTGLGQDSSAQSRTGSYEIAMQFVSRSPVLGRGLGTFLPEYRILDNQLLLLLVEIGLVGLLAFVGLAGTAVVVLHRVRRSVTDEATRDLAQTITAAVVAGLCSMALFDTFSFPMAAGLIFLVLGLSGAMYRLEAATTPHESRTVPALRG